VVPASKIQEKIQKGEPVEYDNVRVTGYLYLRRSHSETNITSPIRINDSIFEGSVDFNGANITSPIRINDSIFEGSVDFNGAILV
jgi:hypothetical protein